MSDCCSTKEKRDWILYGSLSAILITYILGFPGLFDHSNLYLDTFTNSSYELMNKMFIGIAVGIVFVGLLDRVPRQLINKILGDGGTFQGIVRATLGGVLLDMCSHGILLVGLKLYERGASLGQTMAFLIASPWNSFSLTLILWALIGLKWTLAFIAISMAIAVISGVIFDFLVKKGVLPENPNKPDAHNGLSLKQEIRSLFKGFNIYPKTLFNVLKDGILGSKMILRWIFFGVVLAAGIRTFVNPETFETFFGPSLLGLGMTILVATVLEVCSEGTAPVAADILTRAGAPGNSFAFLMTGVSTDYTEILGLRETTRSWKIAFFLPLITLPQIIAVAVVLNMY